MTRSIVNPEYIVHTVHYIDVDRSLGDPFYADIVDSIEALTEQWHEYHRPGIGKYLVIRVTYGDEGYYHLWTVLDGDAQYITTTRYGTEIRHVRMTAEQSAWYAAARHATWTRL